MSDGKIAWSGPGEICCGRVKSIVLVMGVEDQIKGLDFPCLRGRLGKPGSRWLKEDFPPLEIAVSFPVSGIYVVG
jgi:hypothetical protein